MDFKFQGSNDGIYWEDLKIFSILFWNCQFSYKNIRVYKENGDIEQLKPNEVIAYATINSSIPPLEMRKRFI
jgi:hypothetical protein